MGIHIRKRWLWLIIIAFLIKLFSYFPGVVEKYYSLAIYPALSRFLRILFGWIPFSVGDIFYAVLTIYLIVKLIHFIKDLFQKKVGWGYLLGILRRTVFVFLLVYIFFYGLWGLNYNRLGIAQQLHLEVKPYSTQELADITKLIVTRLNDLDSSARVDRDELKSKRTLFSLSKLAYKELASTNLIFTYSSPSVKPSIFSYMGNYLGFTGYYNPFSGEAQVNTTVPEFLQPFTTCHEIGHQLGYAKENEANFVGYLAAKASNEKAFQYSVYFDLYNYAARELYMRDSTLLVPLRESLKPSIRKDFKDLRAFYKKYENPLEPIIGSIYGHYLKANQQPQGLMSYNEVIAWLIAYEKKHGKDAV